VARKLPQHQIVPISTKAPITPKNVPRIFNTMASRCQYSTGSLIYRPIAE
jgi:hypothetical protein